MKIKGVGENTKNNHGKVLKPFCREHKYKGLDKCTWK